ncbi:hypothetical protein ACU8KH_05323 [Lachancea thermotolerans]
MASRVLRLASGLTDQPSIMPHSSPKDRRIPNKRHSKTISS